MNSNRESRSTWRLAAIAGALLVLGHSLGAQTCEPPASSNEVSIFGSRSLALVQSRGIAAGVSPTWTVRVGGEAVALPRVSDAKATPSACRPGKGPENVNVLPGFARLRVAVTLPWNLRMETSWLPPVTIRDVRGNLFGVSVGRVTGVRENLSLYARGHAVVGTVTGPFTCDEDDLRDASSECFGGSVSTDRYRPNILGADVSLDWQRPGSVYSVFGGVGYSRLAPRFRVQFRNAEGTLDSTLVRANIGRVAMFVGTGREFGTRWRASAEVYGTAQDGATVRLVIDALVRRGGKQ